MTYKSVTVAAALALAPLGLALSACSAGTSATEQTGQKTAETVAVTIATAQGQHKFQVERARTAAEQEQGLMYRTDLKPDGGMLFAPYPPEGGGPREANFWMKNTPTSLDILFLRADGTIARIAENTTPFSQTPIPSGEPVAAVLELVGGRSAELGISEGDSVRWAK
ncbi:DUF192 domain-containing protein [uncultured Sphingomonas sp.]|uniref:DUF192 domain-containing protein n=1 Tax=uncultured Sphingomonas sp. TaxID=158754 RepID=UPI0025F04677|nr:DUF192 domain-containing protein [uncultured Sphingomonas sp.]